MNREEVGANTSGNINACELRHSDHIIDAATSQPSEGKGAAEEDDGKDGAVSLMSFIF